MMNTILKACMVVAVLLGFGTQGILHAQKFTEYEVKAVYLYQFVKFVQWPENATVNNDFFIIGVYGENPFGDLPDKIYSDKQFKGKPCKVITLKSMEESRRCELVFVSGVEKYAALKLINYLDGSSVLLVGDNLEDFCQMGGMINFTDKSDKYRLEINQIASQRANFQISSKLSGVARLVDGKGVTF